MSTQQKKHQPKRRRSFTVIKRIFRLLTAMVVVFFISFFTTLAVKSSNPSEYLLSYADDVFDTEGDSSTAFAAEIKQFSSEDKSEGKKKISPVEPKEISEAGLAEKVQRIFSIKEAVDKEIKNTPHYVKLEEMPRSLRQAVISVEDSRFYSHKGFDVESIARAALVNTEAGKIEEGASTITQQLVKNLFLTQEQTFSRKAEELLLAMTVERNFSKDEILEIYLNKIYFGSNFYGIYDASQGYFGKEPKDLTLAESALLAGLPNAPSLYSPYVNFMLAKKRQLTVIDSMKRLNFLTEKEAENARIEEIILVEKEEKSEG